VLGRKRHYLVDTEGHLLAVLVERADIGDRDAAHWVFSHIAARWTELQKVWADQGYTGDLANWLRGEYGIDLEIVVRSTEQTGFTVLPRRWVVERTIAWQGRNRRLSKDYEHAADYSEAWCYIASIQLLLRRLRPSQQHEVPYARTAA
jgi:putative transposase